MIMFIIVSLPGFTSNTRASSTSITNNRKEYECLAYQGLFFFPNFLNQLLIFLIDYFLENFHLQLYLMIYKEMKNPRHF